MMKKLIAFLLSAFMVAGLMACNSANAAGAEETASVDEIAAEREEAEETEAEEEGPADEGTIVISHEYGEAEVAVNPEKVMVLDFGILDILDTLGVEIGGLPASNLPSYLEKYTGDEYLNVGTLKEVDYEMIAEYAPDVIFISGRLSSAYDELSAIAPTVYVINPGAEYMDSLKANVEVLAQIFPGYADELNSGYDALVQAAAAVKEGAEASEDTALIVMANDGNISFFGEGSRYGIIYEDLGFTPAAANIEDSTHGAEGSFEFFTEVDPDIIFVIDRSAAISAEGAESAAAILDNEFVNSTSAAQNGKIIYLDSNVWYTAGGGFYSTAQMIAEAAAAIE